MAGVELDMDRVKRVLSEATRDQRAMSQRKLSRLATNGRDEDAVYDILNDRNRNPTTNLLSRMADALGKDLSIFGIEASSLREEVPTADELEVAIREALADIPRGSLDKRARFLAEAVAQSLRLPPTRPATEATDPTRNSDAPEEGAPPR